jgi:hypothetical protein
MYYKITNKDCDVYQKLHELRTKELKMEEENIQAITEKTGLKWDNSFGHHGQQNFRRVSSYSGFEFKEPEKVDLKIWKIHPEHNTIFVPNLRTKLGREMEEFLRNGLKSSKLRLVLEILKLEDLRKFSFPFLGIVKDEIILLFVDDNHEPKDENVIEITKREFNELISKKA